MKVFRMLVAVAVLSAQFVDAGMDNDTTQMKEKQVTKEKNNNTRLHLDTPNKAQKAQLSAGVNQPSNMPSNKQQSSFKLPSGIHIPAGVPTGIPADIVGKATKKLKDRFGKSAYGIRHQSVV